MSGVREMAQYKKLVKLISSTTLLVILIIALLICNEYASYKFLDSKINNIKEVTQNDTEIFIDTILSGDVKLAENKLSFLTKKLQNDLLSNYKDNMDQLEADLASPSGDSMLSSILNTHFRNEPLDVDNKNNKLFVSTVDHILWINTNSINSDDNSLTCWKDFKTYKYNKVLADKAYNAIKDTNSNNKYIFWQIAESPTKITNMDIDSIYKIYKENGLEGLKSYEMLIPMYITDDGDIFGTSDYNPLGQKNNNYKIIIVQRINLYNALHEYSTEFKDLENKNVLLDNMFEEELNRKIIEAIELFIFSLFLFILSGCVQNKIIKKYNIE